MSENLSPIEPIDLREAVFGIGPLGIFREYVAEFHGASASLGEDEFVVAGFEDLSKDIRFAAYAGALATYQAAGLSYLEAIRELAAVGTLDS